MPEIKRNFIAGKMNKDVDERLVPNGEYRDAMNIQVSTSEESEVGTIQNILGNKNIDWTSNGVPVSFSSQSVCIGSVSDEKNDALYWLVKEPINSSYATALYGTQTWGSGIVKRRNLILQHKDNQITPVLVDIAESYVLGSLNVDTPSTGIINITTTEAFNFIRIGDVIGNISETGQQNTVVNSTTELKVIGKDSIFKTISVGFFQGQMFGTSNVFNPGGVYISINPQRKTLGFKNVDNITGINIIDDMLFFTDGVNEPKKINIPRSIAGTEQDGNSHTLVVNEDQGLPFTNTPLNSTPLVEEKHITVIKKPPKNVLTVKTETSPDFGFGVTFDIDFLQDSANPILGNLLPGDEITSIALTQDTTMGVQVFNLLPQVGDVILLNPVSITVPPEDEHVVKIVVTQIYSSGVINPAFPGGWVTNCKAEIIAIDSAISQVPEQYNWAIDWDRNQRFKDKFPRFSYRYKYQDNEYSSFAPFTNVIFEPGRFIYEVVDAYNIGMENKITRINLSNYSTNLPEDVKSIDLLYKESNSSVVYTIDTIKSENGNILTSVQEYEVKPNQIKAVLPENQLLRAYDNVPKAALAQEITGSRIVYGNYLQNYNLESNPLFSANLLNDRSKFDFNTGSFDGHKSLKSIRNYSLGISYLDKYGRQTPVFTNRQADIEIPIENSSDKNQASVEILGYVPDWATHYKIFVKEISNEYYNLAMDRVYDARDGNVWLSFPSSDRNKVDEETFLILKKGVEEGAIVKESNKYKILAIANEAPTFIKTVETFIGSGAEDPINVASTGVFEFFTDSSAYPIVTKRKVTIDQVQWDAVNVPLVDIETISVKFSRLETSSGLEQVTQTYDVVNFHYDETGEKYKLALEKPIQEEWLTDPNNASQPDPSIGILVYRKVIENRPQFDGRFFVKVSRDILIDDFIISQGTTTIDIETETGVTLPFYYLADSSAPGIGSTGTTAAVTNSGSSNTKTEWESLLNPEGSGIQSMWFIDAAHHEGYWDNDGTLQYHGVLGEDHYGKTEPISECAPELNDGGYNKGIYEENGQTYIDLSFGYVKAADGYAASDTYDWAMHTDSSDIGRVNQAVTTKIAIYAPMDNAGDDNFFQEMRDGYSWKTGFTNGSSVMQGSDNNDLIKHWKIGSSLNPNHDDITTKEIVLKLAQGSKFLFAGDPDSTVYKIVSDPQITYHLNYKNLDDYYYRLDQFLDSCHPGRNPEYNTNTDFGWFYANLNTQFFTGSAATNRMKEIFDEMHAATVALNKRVTWKIPIVALQDSAPNNPTAPNSTFNPINPTTGADATNIGSIQFINQEFTAIDDSIVNENPAVWETEPKKDIDLDIYHEVDSAYPLEINEETNNSFAPPGTIITVDDMSRLPIAGFGQPDVITRLTQWQPVDVNDAGKSNVFQIDQDLLISDGTPAAANWDQTVTFHRPDGSSVRGTMISFPDGYGTGGNAYATQIEIDPDVSRQPVNLSWFNCYSFENGVESDRIRDDFNQVRIDKGAKASSTVEEPYEEERRKYGLIYSGLYNSISGINNLNQFIQAEKITKDINPVYGSIQKLHSRSTADGDLITLCEDRVLKILANKDAVFNADGNTNLTATAKVLGQAIPYSGEYGISENPESFASQSYRVYFTDKVRNAIIRLSKDGLTPISDYGMKDWFRDNLKLSNKLIGSFDDRNEEYNVTLDNSTDGLPKTVSFKENVRGWVSFKSFIPENGLSCANKYYTFLNGKLYLHHSEDVDRNTFYDNQLLTSFTASSVDIIFNEQPGSVKSFKTINYEGSQAKVNKILNDNGVIIQDNQYFNLKDVEGWYASTIFTDLEIGTLTDFIEKEGKWFGHIAGEDVNINSSGVITENFDTSDFSIQGIGVTTLTTTDIIFGCTDNTMFNYDPAATNDDGSCIMFNYGCMDPDADTYNAVANTDDGSCLYYGCTDSTTLAWASGYLMINYDPTANFDDGSCVEAIIGCLLNPGYVNYNPLANASCGGDYPLQGDPMGQPANYCCEAEVEGCLDMTATADNYDATVNVDDGSCEWTGCTDPTALNYAFAGSFNPIVDGTTGNPADLVYLNGVAIDDGLCNYPGGCTDPAACNYDSTPGLVDNGSCTYCGDATNTSVINYDGGSCNNGCLYCDCPTIVPTVINSPSDLTNGVDQFNGNVTISFLESTSASEYKIEFISGPLTGQIYNFNSQSTSFTHNLGSGGDLTATGFGSGTVVIQIDNLPAGTYQFVNTSLCDDLGNNQHGYVGLVACPNYNAQPFPGLPPNEIFIVGSNDITPGCTDATACNYNPAAFVDDGSCIAGSNCTGCTDSSYLEFCNTCWDSTNNIAVTSGGGPWVFSDNANLCITLIAAGCTDPAAFNYDPAANFDDGSCVPVILGCTDSTLNNDGTPAASNYNALANTDDGSCNSYNCPIITTSVNAGSFGVSSSYQIDYDVSNTPYASTLVQGGEPSPSILSVGLSYEDSNSNVNSGASTNLYGSVPANSLTPLANFFVTSQTGGSYINSRTFNIENFVANNTNNNNFPLLNNNLTSIDISISLATNDGNCVVSHTETLTIGCNDASAANSGSAVNGFDFDIADDSQCIYAGCMDATSNTDGVGFFATNYDSNAGTPCQTNPVNASLTGDNACCTYPLGTRREWTAFNALSTSGGGYSALIIADDYSGTAFTNTDHFIKPGTATISTTFTSQYDGSANNASGTTLVPASNSFLGLLNSNTDAEGLPIAGVLQADCNSTAANAIQGVPCIEWGPYLVIDQATQTATLNVKDVARDYKGSATTGGVVIDNASRNNELGAISDTTLIDETYTVGCKSGGYNFFQPGSYWNQTNQVDLNDSSMCILEVEGCADPNATAEVVGATTGLGSYGFYDPTATMNCDGTVIANVGVNTGCCCYDCATPGFGVDFVSNVVSNTSGTGASQLNLNWSTVPHARHYIIEFIRTDVPQAQSFRASFIVDSTTPGFSTGSITVDADYLYQNITNADIHLGLDTASQEGMFIDTKEYRFYIKADCDTMFVDPNDSSNNYLQQCNYPDDHLSGEDDAVTQIQI